MTCIVGVVDGKRILIGADSAGVAGLDLEIRKDTKVFNVGEFLIGYTSSFRMGQLLQYRLEPPAFTEEPIDLHRYMATAFVDAVRQCLKDGGYATRNNEQESGGEFLVGIRGRLFRIEGDYQVAELADGFSACGCGAQIALGSLFSTPDTSVERRIEIALKAAERFSAGVRGPFAIKAIG